MGKSIESIETSIQPPGEKSMNTSPRVAFSKSNASVLLDLLRAVAALLVCIDHWRNIFFLEFRQLSGHKLLLAPFYLATDAGRQCVMVFFVLSGYLISKSIFRMVRTGGWNWRLYLTHRIVRLWIVLIPALILGCILDNIGLRLPQSYALYAGQTGTHVLPNAIAALHLSVFFGNLVFLQTIFVPTFGSNAPLWSLAYEFWYYILFPCAYLLLRKGTSLQVRILSGVAFLVCAALAGRTILLYFPLWLLGTALALLGPAHVGAKIRWFAVILYVPFFFFMSKTSLVHGLFSDYLLGTATFVFVWLLLGAQSAAPESPSVEAVRRSAQFSYTLYLVHMPFLVLLSAAVSRGIRFYPDPLHLLIAFAILAVTVAYAYVVACASEFRTSSVRAWAEKLVMGKSLKDLRTPSTAAQPEQSTS
jgi:peptidoglycan/LPS O-acetylase OafA/YrhL